MLHRAARNVRRAGRHGDDVLVHINKRELGYLSQIWGKPSRNPTTGLPEFFDLGGFLAQYVAPAAVSAIAAPAIGDFFGNALSDYTQTAAGAGLGALTSGALNGFNGQNLFTGAGLGAAAPNAANALGFQGYQNPFNIPTLFNVPGSLGLSSTTGFDPSKAIGPGNMPVNDNPNVFDPSQPIGPNNVPTNDNPATASSANPAGTVGTDRGSFGLPGPSPDGAGSTSGKVLDFIKKNPGVALTALGALASLASPRAQQPQGQATPVAPPPNQAYANYTFPTGAYGRSRTPTGMASAAPTGPGEFNFYANNYLPKTAISTSNQGVITAAHGGSIAGGPSGPGTRGIVSGPGDGRADVIPAKLSKDEYVMDAETVALFGNGSPEAGARKFDEFRAGLRKQKGRSLAKGKFSPDARQSVQGYLGATS